MTPTAATKWIYRAVYGPDGREGPVHAASNECTACGAKSWPQDGQGWRIIWVVAPGAEPPPKVTCPRCRRVLAEQEAT